MADLLPRGTDDAEILRLYIERLKNVKVDRLMTATWNFKNIYLARHPDDRNSSWVIELEEAMKFVDGVFPLGEDRQWRK